MDQITNVHTRLHISEEHECKINLITFYSVEIMFLLRWKLIRKVIGVINVLQAVPYG